MKTYEAWLTDSPGSLKVRLVAVYATSEQEAFAQAKALCNGSEFVRGVNEIAPEGRVEAKPTLTEALYERKVDSLVWERLNRDSRFKYAENAEEQAQAEERITAEVEAEVSARYEVI